MKNPIAPDFDWSSLYEKYDATCKRFDPNYPSLFAVIPKPANDRHLYYALIDRVTRERSDYGFIGLGTYEGILYWKLYSQPAARKNICDRIRNDITSQEATQEKLRNLCQLLPQAVPENIEDVRRLFQTVQRHNKGLFGLSNSCALPVRSTILHFLYPSILPIFDKQVLHAVGVTDKDANKKRDMLFEYVQKAWDISKNPCIPHNWQETPLRLVDMALWVIRNKQNRLNIAQHSTPQSGHM